MVANFKRGPSTQIQFGTLLASGYLYKAISPKFPVFIIFIGRPKRRLSRAVSTKINKNAERSAYNGNTSSDVPHLERRRLCLRRPERRRPPEGDSHLSPVHFRPEFISLHTSTHTWGPRVGPGRKDV